MLTPAEHREVEKIRIDVIAGKPASNHCTARLLAIIDRLNGTTPQSRPPQAVPCRED